MYGTMSRTDSLFSDPTFGRDRPLLWPALILLKRGRDHESSLPLLTRVGKALRTLRFKGEDRYPPDLLRSPVSIDNVLKWLDLVWHSLESAPHAKLVDTRRNIMNEIMGSGLSSEEQSLLLTALDYLFRLSAAAKLSATSRRRLLPEVPSSKSIPMQAVYLKLAGLAATDLPVWLVGEKGTELEWAAGLIHRLRGLPEDTFVVWGSEQALSAEKIKSWNGAETDGAAGQETTVFITDLDRTSESFQRSLYGLLAGQLGHTPAFRLIVTSQPLNPLTDPQPGYLVDLFAFLAPTRVEIPPLRDRMEDLPALMAFLAGSQGRGDPTGRVTSDAMDLLHEYGWPGNMLELQTITDFLVRRRPAGAIRPEHLPGFLRASPEHEGRLMDILLEIHKDDNFRALKSEAGRRRLAQFLFHRSEDTFKASDVQRLFTIGRETARRLLVSLQEKGLIEGLRGAKSLRTTRYRPTAACGRFGPAEE